MHRWIKILVVCIAVVLAFVYIAAHLFFAFQGKSIIISHMTNLTQKPVTLGRLGVNPLFKLKIEDLEIKDTAKIKYIYVSPSIIGLALGNIAFNEVQIIRPEFTIEKLLSVQENVVSAPGVKAAGAASPEKEPLPRQKENLLQVREANLILKRLSVKEGTVNFIDHTAGPSGIKITLKDLYFQLTNLYLVSRPVIANFELKARIPWQGAKEEGRIEAEGWINLFKKDIQATLKISDIDGIALFPYYSSWVDLEKARIDKAKLSFTSNIQGLNNSVIADCRLELTDIVRRPLTEGEAEEKASRITDAVLGILRSLDQGRITLNFTIRTRMDRPEFGFGSIRTAFEDKLFRRKKPGGFKLQDIFMLPANIVHGTVKSVTDLSRAVIDGTFGVGKEFKKAVEDTFKK